MSRCIGAVVAGVGLVVATACGTRSARLDAVPPVPPPAAPLAVASEATDRESPPPAPSETSPHDAPRGSTCGLRSTLGSLGQKDGVEQYSLTLTNTSEQPVQLVLPGDGSQVGWRTPILTWTAKSGGKPIAELAPARCGMMNAIEASEIFTLAPGASRTLVEWLGWPRYAPGTYDLEVRYRNDPSLGAHKASAAPDVAAKLASSGACDVTSNAIRATFR